MIAHVLEVFESVVAEHGGSDEDEDTDFIDAGDYNDDRTHNDVNELTARDTDDNGTDNFALTYFKTGAVKNDGEHYKYVWDAFGRLRKVLKRSNNALVAEYTYNGLGFRISEHHDTDIDGDVDGDDVTYRFVYDDSWRIVATYVDDDDADDAKEIFVHHCAGDSGYGTSSYIDAVILRDADDPEDSWTDPSDSDLEMRLYYCQNWRADVAVVIHDSATLVERVMYSPYGVPFGIPCGDLVDSSFAQPSDGTVGGADQSKLLADWGSSHTIADLDNDGDVDGMDLANLNANWGITLGWGAMSYTHNRLGYAGYVFDEALAGTKWHVRWRVLESVLGRWVSRDPLTYANGPSLIAYVGSNPLYFVDPYGLSPYLNECAKDCDKDYPSDPEAQKACLIGCVHGEMPGSSCFIDCRALARDDEKVYRACFSACARSLGAKNERKRRSFVKPPTIPLIDRGAYQDTGLVVGLSGLPLGMFFGPIIGACATAAGIIIAYHPDILDDLEKKHPFYLEYTDPNYWDPNFQHPVPNPNYRPPGWKPPPPPEHGSPEWWRRHWEDAPNHGQGPM